MLTMTDSTNGNTRVLHLSGPLAGAEVAALRPRLAAVVAPANADVLADFSAVTLLDGAGIGALAFLHRRLAANGRRLGVVGATGQPRDCLRDLGLGRLLAA